MTQTAVEWLIEKMLDSGIGICKEWREQAKEMEKQQIIDANYDGQRLHSKSCTKQMLQDNAESYFDETYGSKGSDENFKQFSLYEHKETISSADTITSPQTEISDEEIEKWIEENYKPNLIRIYVYEGIKWYREQLKTKI